MCAHARHGDPAVQVSCVCVCVCVYVFVCAHVVCRGGMGARIWGTSKCVPCIYVSMCPKLVVAYGYFLMYGFLTTKNFRRIELLIEINAAAVEKSIWKKLNATRYEWLLFPVAAAFG